jgi:hypothetical protein
MKYVDDMGSDGMLYLPSFVKIGSGIQELKRVIHRHTDIQVALKSHKRTSIFFKLREVDQEHG